MKQQLIRWLLPLIVILAIATVMALNVSLNMAHAAPTTPSQHTHIVSPAKPDGITPASFWRG